MIMSKSSSRKKQTLQKSDICLQEAKTSATNARGEIFTECRNEQLYQLLSTVIVPGAKAFDEAEVNGSFKANKVNQVDINLLAGFGAEGERMYRNVTYVD